MAAPGEDRPADEKLPAAERDRVLKAPELADEDDRERRRDAGEKNEALAEKAHPAREIARVSPDVHEHDARKAERAAGACAP